MIASQKNVKINFVSHYSQQYLIFTRVNELIQTCFGNVHIITILMEICFRFYMRDRPITLNEN